MTRTLRLFVVALVVAMALFGVFASSALASLETTPIPTLMSSSSNPGTGADYWWREGWGNSLYPDFELNPPAIWDEQIDGYLIGSLYTIDRTGNTIINTATPSAYYRDTFPTALAPIGGTLTTHTVDMLGIYQNPPGGGWPALPAGAHNQFEGMWYYHWLYYSSLRYQNGTPDPLTGAPSPYPWTVGFGIDLTPPKAVTGLRLRTGLTTSDVTTWTPASRALISWDATEPDELSGTGYYQVLIDGAPYIPETSATPSTGRVYSAPWLPTPSDITVENMPSGAHFVQIQPVDRATNVGPPSVGKWFYSDPDTPTIAWTVPSGSVLDPRTRLISVDASDKAGDPVVNITLNGANIATLTAPPYQITPDLSALATGTYTLTATAKDHLNRTVTISKSVTWNPFGLAGSTPDSSVDVTTTPALSIQSAETSTGGTTGWTNNLFPTAFLLQPSGATDAFYNIVQTPAAIDTTNLQNYYHSLRGSGTELNETIDLKDTIDNPPPGGWASLPAGAVAPYEGSWYFQWVWYNHNSLGVSSQTYRLRYNVDLTPPLAVQGFTATPTPGVWTTSQRVNLHWTGKEYDALSGDNTYQIYLDDSPVMSTSATQAVSSATIEDLPAGRHKLSIAAIDRAGNIGPKTDVYSQVDTDTPTIAWNLPSDPAMNQSNDMFEVVANDQAGTPTVNFSIDHDPSFAATVTAPPYDWSPDMFKLSTGAHVAYATVTDSYGRSVTTSMAITWSTPLVPDAVADYKVTDPGPASLSNPSNVKDPEAWWRGGWGRNLYPDIELNPPSIDEKLIPTYGMIVGVLYDVSTNADDINPATPEAYFRAGRPAGTNMNQTIDLQGVYNYPPLGGWRSGLLPGATTGIEGPWYMNMRFLTSNGICSSHTYHVPLGIDITPPSAVQSMVVSPSMNTADATGSITTSRIYISWKKKDYDQLSGDAYYQIYIDGQPAVPESDSNPVQGRVYNLPGAQANSAMIENMPPGLHTIGVAPVDRATNVGPMVTQTLWSDPDTPTIAWRDPSGMVLDPRTSLISVDASDAAGNPRVTLSLGTTATPSMVTTTIAAPPYAFTPNLSSLATGTYVITGTVRDHAGRTVTISKSVFWGPYAVSGSVGSTVDQSVDVTGVPGTSLDSAETSSGGTTGWTNNLNPIAELAAPGGATDMFYDIVQTPGPIDNLNLQNYYRSNSPQGTLLDQSVSLKDTIDSGAPWLPGPTGSVAPYEGSWYFQWIWYNQNSLGVSSQTYRLRFNVDLTPPAAVTGFTSTPDASSSWTSSKRATFKWNALQYDALSGDQYYQLYIDDAPVVSISATSALAGQATIENMPPGRHKVSIAAVDMAGNVGAKRSIYFQSDWDIPTVRITEPTSTITPAAHTVSVSASDAAGIQNVQLFISGGSFVTPVLLGTMASPPYTITPNFSAMGMADGTYTLRAVATDLGGHTATATLDVVWDTSSALVTNPEVDLAPGTNIGTSMSNPSALNDPDAWWRQGWGNSLTPDFELSPPTPTVSTAGFLVGMLYDVTTSPNDINTSQPDLYYRASRGTGTNTSQTVDLLGVYNYPPVGGWRPSPITGATSDIEGPWYFNLTWFTSMGFSSTRTYHVPMGLDVTPPSQVASLVVSPTLRASDATTVINASRVNISWKAKQYDALSGVAYYQILVDGSTLIPDSPSNPPQGRVYNIPGASPNSVSLEGLTPGKHKIGIEAVDRATNVGPPIETTIICDTDAPTVKLTSPVGAVVGVHPTIAASASDLAGIRSVVFKLDGVTLATDTVAPYKGNVDLSAFTAGDHVLSATATDLFGRQVTDSRTVTLDKVPLVLSSIKTTASGRAVSVKFTVNRPATVVLNLSIAGYSSRVLMSGQGSYTFKYTYPKGRTYPSSTSFSDTFTLTASDPLGNSASASGKVKVTLAKIIKLANNKFKIIYY